MPQTEPAIKLVHADVVHARHGQPQHRLARKTLSIWIDLDRLKEADQQSGLFSVGRFNLLSFHSADFGPNHKSQAKSGRRDHDLASYARSVCALYLPDTPIASVRLLTMPRILGMGFNPISVYLCTDNKGADRFVIYEVHNTFGDSHSYVGIVDDTGKTMLHETEKKLHVSPFFPVDGHYNLRFRADAQSLFLLVRYYRNNRPALTATQRGNSYVMTTGTILKSLFSGIHLPMRPWLAIHVEAVKLFIKKCAVYDRPAPPATSHSKAVPHHPRRDQ